MKFKFGPLPKPDKQDPDPYPNWLNTLFLLVLVHIASYRDDVYLKTKGKLAVFKLH
jgi:hypothetical protein